VHRLRVETLVERRRADEIGEHDRDDLARTGILAAPRDARLSTGLRRGRQRRTAGAAELCRGGTETPARRAASLKLGPTFLAERGTVGILVPTRCAVHGIGAVPSMPRPPSIGEQLNPKRGTEAMAAGVTGT